MTRQATMSEQALQQHVVKLLEAFGRPEICWFSIPNGELRNHRVGVKLKAAGLRAGAADLFFVIDGTPHAIELKTEIGTLSPKQLQFREDLERAGGFFHAAFGLQEAIGVLKGIKAFRPNVNITLSPTIADDGRGARRRPWQSKAKVANAAPEKPSPVKPRRAADPVSPNT